MKILLVHYDAPTTQSGEYGIYFKNCAQMIGSSMLSRTRPQLLCPGVKPPGFRENPSSDLAHDAVRQST
jgi:hypothetical protein